MSKGDSLGEELPQQLFFLHVKGDSFGEDLSCSLIDVCGSFTELHVPENEHVQCSNLFLYSPIQTLQSVSD